MNQDKILKELEILSNLKKEIKLSSERMSKHQTTLYLLSSLMNYSKKYLNSMGYVGEEDICREDSIIDAICNILYVGGEMTTQEIFKGLVKEGVTWKGKKPITSLILTGVLHRETTRKVTQKFKRSIIKVGRGRWKIIYKGKFSNL